MEEEVARSARFRFGPFELDTESGDLVRDGRAVRLQPQPARLLAYLLRRPGELVTRDDLRRQVWTDDTSVDFEQGLNFCIRQVRTALGDTAETPRFIQTLPRRGYRFIAPVSREGLTRASGARAPAPEPLPSGDASVPKRRWSYVEAPGLTWMAAALVVGIAAGAAWLVARSVTRQGDPVGTVRFELSVPEGASLTHSSVPVASPDGRQLVYSAMTPAGRSALWLRRMDRSDAQFVPGTEDAAAPFWAPDGRRIGFFTLQELRYVDLADGKVTTVCAEAAAAGGTWAPGDRIVFGRAGGSLYSVSAAGGRPTAITTLDGQRGEVSHAWPSWLPDGRRLLFLVERQVAGQSEIQVLTVDGGARRAVVLGASNAVFLPPDQVLYVSPDTARMPRAEPWRVALVRSGTLRTLPLDERKPALAQDGVVVVERVGYSAAESRGLFSSSAAGVVAYRPASSHARTEMAWFDRAGRKLSVLAADTFYPHPTISPDGTQAAFNQNDAERQNPDIWVADLVRGTRRRVTFDAAVDAHPVWSRSGSFLLFASDRETPAFDIYRVSLVQGSPAQRVLSSADLVFPSDALGDDAALIERYRPGAAGAAIERLSLSTARLDSVYGSDTAKYHARVSPDGRWVAYTTLSRIAPLSGAASVVQAASTVVIEPLPATGARWQVDVDGATQPEWRADGRELFVLRRGSPPKLASIFAVDVQADGGGLRLGKPTLLFDVPVLDGPAIPLRDYAVTPDGLRFLIDTVVRPAPAAPMTVLIDR
jgi:eukaryotic-like serine/threonine-protein kinase